MTEISAPELQRILNASMTERGPARTLKISTPVGSLFLAVEVTDGQPEIVISSPQRIDDTTIRTLLDALADGVTRLMREGG